MKPYISNTLPINNLDYQLLFSLVGDANSELAHYDGLLQGIPNPAVMLSLLTTREAVLSSKIEGTQATVDEVRALNNALFCSFFWVKSYKYTTNPKMGQKRAIPIHKCS